MYYPTEYASFIKRVRLSRILSKLLVILGFFLSCVVVLFLAKVTSFSTSSHDEQVGFLMFTTLGIIPIFILIYTIPTCVSKRLLSSWERSLAEDTKLSWFLSSVEFHDLKRLPELLRSVSITKHSSPDLLIAKTMAEDFITSRVYPTNFDFYYAEHHLQSEFNSQEHTKKEYELDSMLAVYLVPTQTTRSRVF